MKNGLDPRLMGAAYALGILHVKDNFGFAGVAVALDAGIALSPHAP